MTIPGFEDMLHQAQHFAEQLAKLKEELARKSVSGTAGGGMVKVTADGRGRILKVELEPQVVNSEEVEMLQDLICAAVNQALVAAKELSAQATQSLTGGMSIPGIDGLLG